MKYQTNLLKRKKELSISFNQISSITGVSLYSIKRTFEGYRADGSFAVLDLMGFDSSYRAIKTSSEVTKSYIEKRANLMLSRVVHSCALEEQIPSDQVALKIRENIIKQLKQLPRSKLWQ